MTMKIRYRPRTCGEFIDRAAQNRSNKLRRKTSLLRSKRFAKHQKRVFRGWQGRHHGRLPDLSVIPDSFYCYTYDGGQIRHCPHWEWIPIPENELDDHIGVVAKGQQGIGRCHLIDKTDDDLGGWGLLWDSCKECGFRKDKPTKDNEVFEENADPS